MRIRCSGVGPIGWKVRSCAMGRTYCIITQRALVGRFVGAVDTWFESIALISVIGPILGIQRFYVLYLHVVRLLGGQRDLCGLALKLHT